MLLFQIGSFTAAIAAKEHNKPVFVLAESFKFVRLYPLNQRDVPNNFKVRLMCPVSVIGGRNGRNIGSFQSSMIFPRQFVRHLLELHTFSLYFFRGPRRALLNVRDKELSCTY